MVSEYFGVNKNDARCFCFLHWVFWFALPKDPGDAPAQSVAVGAEREPTIMAGRTEALAGVCFITNIRPMHISIYTAWFHGYNTYFMF
jgi:hypothetical protein